MKRCAIYTRKSTEEGLDQDFNSLDAQRQACESFVTSQSGLGWSVLTERYDDGGISGGSMERPALQKLLDHITAGRIDVVLVYKIDRLTRSLGDFGRIVEIFDQHNVSFVSVTQQFNTTTSMGRLTLNVLLSFAQFEREVTAERIRDKIAASKKKGIWMGGPVPLGYTVQDRKLVINEREACTIRWIYTKYRRLRCVAALKRAADKHGIVSKIRIKPDGSMTGGRPISRGNFQLILRNPIYAGLIGHKGELYQGQQQAIIARDEWKTVQSMLEANRGAWTKSASAPALFSGLLFDQHGDRMVHHHANKKGVRYHYYVSNQLLRGNASNGTGIRLPAATLEQTVIEGLSRWLCTPKTLLDAIETGDLPVETQSHIIKNAKALAGRIGEPIQDLKSKRILILNLISKVQLQERSIWLEVDRQGLCNHLAAGEDVTANNRPISIAIPFTKVQRGRLARLVLAETGSKPSNINQALIRLVATAHRRFAELTAGSATSTGDLAKHEKTDPSELSRTLQLAHLAPDIIEKILTGQQPDDLTATKLKKLRNLPLSWQEQRELLGFGGSN